ncbi:MAG: glycosyltransferase [Bacteroidaceae bacterium]|nr:glycosyltransferase [Bacteroidaceae bacterium]
MISLIICSTQSDLSKSLKENIRSSICSKYEIVHIDNSQRRYNIFEAYNIGVERSSGEYLCFMHEDIVFRRQGWGKIIEQTLSHNEVGALGVAGGHVVLDQLDWRFYGFLDVCLIQGNTSVEPNPIYYRSSHARSNDYKGLRHVAVIDGVWMCMRKELFNIIRFDEQTFHDFHLYDSDICMQINKQGYGVYVTHDVLLEHRSEGTFSEGYQHSLNLFFKKWGDSLPFIRGLVLSKEEISKKLPKARQLFAERLKRDAIAIGIRKLIQQRRSGVPSRSFTEEEKEVMDISSFIARKAIIKDKLVSTRVAWKYTLEYLRYPFVRHRGKLLSKFFWYRFIKR